MNNLRYSTNMDVVYYLKHSIFIPLLSSIFCHAAYFTLIDCYPTGVADKVQAMDELKIKGLIIGPIHVSSADEPEKLKLTEISEEAGNLTQFQEVIKAAHKRGEL